MGLPDDKNRKKGLRLFGLVAIIAVGALVVFLAYPKVNQVEPGLAPRPEINSGPLSCLSPESGPWLPESESWLADVFNQGLFIDMIMMTPSDGSAPPHCPDGITARWHFGPPAAYYNYGECYMSFSASPSHAWYRPKLPQGPGIPRPADWWYEFFRRQAEMAENVYECMGACNGVHEGRHAKDFHENPNIRLCVTEQNAFKEARNCLIDCANRLCFGYPEPADPPIDRPPNFPCAILYNNIDLHRLAIVFNECLCRSPVDPSGPDDRICQDCVEECKRHELGNKRDCGILSQAYCKPTRPPRKPECDPTPPDVDSNPQPLDPALQP
jgi:hypothetical protein